MSQACLGTSRLTKIEKRLAFLGTRSPACEGRSRRQLFIVDVISSGGFFVAHCQSSFAAAFAWPVAFRSPLQLVQLVQLTQSEQLTQPMRPTQFEQFTQLVQLEQALQFIHPVEDLQALQFLHRTHLRHSTQLVHSELSGQFKQLVDGFAGFGLAGFVRCCGCCFCCLVVVVVAPDCSEQGRALACLTPPSGRCSTWRFLQLFRKAHKAASSPSTSF